jgi:hypothetical protein
MATSAEELVVHLAEGQQKRMEQQESIRASLLPFLEKNDFLGAGQLVIDHGWRFDNYQYARDAFLEYPPKNVCPDCGSEVEWNLNGILEWRMDFCAECRWREVQAEIARDLKKIMYRLGASHRFLDAKLTDFNQAYQDAVKTEKGLYIVGSRGVGKTHLATALLRQMIFDHPRAERIHYDILPAIVSVPELLMRIKATFNKESKETEDEVLDLYSDLRVLILDDLGTEKPTEWAISTLYLIIDRRYRDMRKTIITSNCSLDEIAERLDDRISSRIAEMCNVIRMKGKDRRLV